METNKFTIIMSEKDDVELIRITTSERADYQPEAVIAAEDELKKRNITPSICKDFAEKVEKLVEVEKGRKEEMQRLHLPTWVKVIAFIFPIPLLFIIGLILMLFGYQTRGNQLCKWVFFGWIFYFALYVFMEICI